MHLTPATFTIAGLSPASVAPLLEADDEQLARLGAQIVRAASKPGYPCRITLEDAEPGEELILFHHESHSARTPYRSAYAIYIRRQARRAARFVDTLPPVFHGRPIALRLFDGRGMLVGADMATGEAIVDRIRAAFARADVAYIHAHNAMHGCFAAAITRTTDAV
jgi:hypothetical protein